LARGAHHNLGVHFNIYTMAEASEEKVDVVLYYRSSAKFWDSPLISAQWLKLATSNLACSWGTPRPTIKPQPEEKWTWPWAREAPKYLGFPFNISATASLSC